MTDMELEPLNASDRCDTGGCNAQAFVRIRLLTGNLIFCSHHFHTNELALAPVTITVDDYRDQINVKASASSA